MGRCWFRYVPSATLHRWIERGKSAPRGTVWRRFLLSVLEAEAQPGLQALGDMTTQEAATDYLDAVGEFTPPQPQWPADGVVRLSIPKEIS
jgi:hypothetical protein